MSRRGTLAEMTIVVEQVTEEARVGAHCRCGGCHPTTTVYRDDPRLAQGSCCCGRFFVIGETEEKAQERAAAMAEERRGQGMAPNGYLLATQPIALPRGAEAVAVVADFRQ